MHKILDDTSFNLANGLDIVTLMRRLRMHGFAIATSMEQKTLNIIANRSKRTPLIKVKAEAKTQLWKKYETYSYCD